MSILSRFSFIIYLLLSFQCEIPDELERFLLVLFNLFFELDCLCPTNIKLALNYLSNFLFIVFSFLSCIQDQLHQRRHIFLQSSRNLVQNAISHLLLLLNLLFQKSCFLLDILNHLILLLFSDINLIFNL